MSLAHPEYLWALAVLPLLWWLSRPPAPRRHLWTAHMQQWQLAMRALRRRPPRGSWLRLLLLAIALVAAVFAAAGAQTAARPGPMRLVVLLDASASMAAARGGASAFDRARAKIAARLAALPAHVEVTLLRCGGDLRRRYGEAARQLSDVGRPSGELDVDLAGLADALRSAETQVWACTDGQGQVRLPAAGALDVFDARGDNASVLAVRVEDRWPLPDLRVEIDVVVHAAAGSAVQIMAAGAVEGGAQRRTVDWTDSQTATVSLDLQRLPGGGELELRVMLPGDVLPADDVRRLRLPPLPAPRVAVLEDEAAGPFAAVAAKALAEEVRGKVVEAAAGGEVGLLLVDGGVTSMAAGAVRALTFGARLPGQEEPEAWLSPQGIDWDREHVVTRGLDLSELEVDRAWRDLLPEGEPLIWSDEGGQREPLAVLVQGEGVASLHFAFRLRDANLPLLAAFPQLLRRGFVRSYDKAASLERDEGALPAGELDLRYAQPATSRPLGRFGAPPESLARWWLAVGLLSLGLRAFVR